MDSTISHVTPSLSRRFNTFLHALAFVAGFSLIFGLMRIANLTHGALFMLGASFLLGGLKHHVQEYNRVSARLQAALLFLATIALLVPSSIAEANRAPAPVMQTLSLGLAVLLLAAYGLGMLFSLKTHREFFLGAEHEPDEEAPWPIAMALVLWTARTPALNAAEAAPRSLTWAASTSRSIARIATVPAWSLRSPKKARRAPSSDQIHTIKKDLVRRTPQAHLRNMCLGRFTLCW